MRNVDKKYHLLYKTTNLLNEKYYYGIHSTNKIEDGYLGSGKHFRYSLRKYGKENFKREILEMFDNREDLVKAEIDLLTREILEDKQCMNCQFGGEKWNTLGMVTVKGKNGKTFKVFCNDPRYISGELVHITKNKIVVSDGNKFFQVDKNDSRYLSGKLIISNKNKFFVKDKFEKIHYISINDPKYLSGEFVPVAKGLITVKDKDNNTFSVSINDPRYLNDELKPFWKDRKHSDETKKKMSESNKGQNLGEKNGSYGTCWITNSIENKKIKKEELENYIQLGWSKGRKINNKK